MILNGVWDHVVSHVTAKGMTKEMWDTFSTLYEGTTEQEKMYLEEKLSLIQMQKGEGIDSFLTRIQLVQDQWSVVRAAPQPADLV